MSVSLIDFVTVHLQAVAVKRRQSGRLLRKAGSEGRGSSGHTSSRARARSVAVPRCVPKLMALKKKKVTFSRYTVYDRITVQSVLTG